VAASRLSSDLKKAGLETGLPARQPAPQAAQQDSKQSDINLFPVPLCESGHLMAKSNSASSL
jgi:hypothetical protein